MGVGQLPKDYRRAVLDPTILEKLDAACSEDPGIDSDTIYTEHGRVSTGVINQVIKRYIFFR